MASRQKSRQLGWSKQKVSRDLGSIRSAEWWWVDDNVTVHNLTWHLICVMFLWHTVDFGEANLKWFNDTFLIFIFFQYWEINFTFKPNRNTLKFCSEKTQNLRRREKWSIWSSEELTLVHTLALSADPRTWTWAWTRPWILELYISLWWLSFRRLQFE